MSPGCRQVNQVSFSVNHLNLHQLFVTSRFRTCWRFPDGSAVIVGFVFIIYLSALRSSLIQINTFTFSPVNSLMASSCGAAWWRSVALMWKYIRGQPDIIHQCPACWPKSHKSISYVSPDRRPGDGRVRLTCHRFVVFFMKQREVSITFASAEVFRNSAASEVELLNGCCSLRML